MLAMRRLSIIDLAGANQPLWNEDRSVAMVFNGEIYNYVELREKLERRGHVLSTHGDGETIPHLYEEYGLDFVHHLRGMFAIALWDSSRRRLVLARDRMGEKPLYLHETQDGLVFASELRALLKSGLVPLDLDPVSVDQFLHCQYVPEPRTIVRNVRKLDAAHWLTVDQSPWKLTERRYWSMEDAPPLDGNPAEVIRAELENVCRLVIRSDVPVGVALSGGLDSSAIAVLAAKAKSGNLHAFTVGYPGAPWHDERGNAKQLADHLGIPFHGIELDTADMVRNFPELVCFRDDPVADISGYGYYAVARLAREHNVPVLLLGQGGDELFWGYEWVRQAVRYTALKNRIPAWGRLLLPAYLRLRMPDGLRPWQIRMWLEQAGGLREGWCRFHEHRALPLKQAVFYDLTPDFRDAQRRTPSLYTPLFKDQLKGTQATDLFTFEEPVRNPAIRMTRLIADLFLREDGIAQGDRLSMASSVEMRLPLCDYRLVETVLGLRKTRPDSHLPPKKWFKDAVRDILPTWVMNRIKLGFTPPVWDWYRALFAAYGNDLRDGWLVQAGIFSREAAGRLASGSAPRDAGTPLSFKALVLETWCRQVEKYVKSER